MTKTKIVALLSILALLASLPLTVAVAQGAPYLVIGSAMLDDEPAMMGTHGRRHGRRGKGRVWRSLWTQWAITGS